MDKDKIREDALEFLRENSTAIVATSVKDEPRVSTVYYFVDDEFNFYFATKRKTSKYINLGLNPRASFVVGTGPSHISVQAYGLAEIVVGDVERERILNLLMGKQNIHGVKVRPIDDLKNFKESYKVVFKIVPHELFFMNMDSEKHKGTQSNELMKII